MADGTHACCGQSWIDGCACPPAPENPQAFPVSSIDGFTQHGMDLRDWFAGKALCGLRGLPLDQEEAIHVARRAYLTADAMLAARAHQSAHFNDGDL